LGKHILITGGAGFIGSHLADELLRSGHTVRVLDNLSSQVHGPGCRYPEYLDRAVELIVGDVRDAGITRRSLKDVDAVYHFAAVVGVGQSMYEMAKYASVNCFGTAVLLEEIARRPVEKIIVASSMSIYGEGLYRDSSGGLHEDADRPIEQLRAACWEVRNGAGETLVPVPTPETKKACLASVYALTKYDQERMCLMFGRAYGIPAVALRFFNAFGTRQSLSNPYTGVLAIFAARYLNNNAPLIFEDGKQQRDFVNVHDVVRACRLALEKPQANGLVINVGSGQPHTVCEVAEAMGHVLGKRIAPEITGMYRAGDIRHCYADITLAQKVLGYTPRVSLERGLAELASWLEGRIAQDRVAEARAELAARGLTA